MRRRRAHRRRRASLVVVAAGLATFCVLAGRAEAGWKSAGITSSIDTLKSAALSFSHTYAGTSCSGTASGTVVCSGSPAPAGASTSWGSAQTRDDVLGNASTVAATAAYTEQVRLDSCNPTQFADARGSNADPMLPRYRVGRQATDPWGTTSAASFDGVKNYAADIVPRSTATVAGLNYSVGVWFRTAAGSAGGGLLSLNADPRSVTSLGANPALYLDSAGRVRYKADRFFVAAKVASSGTDYRDNAWHLAVVTVSQGATDVVSLYLDGAFVGSDETASQLAGSSSDSYWHLGWTDTTGLDGSPGDFFAGSLSGAFITSTTLTPGAVIDLRNAGGASAYAAALTGASHLWMLGDDVTSTYGGAVGFVDTQDPCTEVELSWTLAGTEAFNDNLAALEGTTWRPTTPVAAPSRGNTQTLRLSYQRVLWFYDSNVAGMELLVPLSHRVSLTGAPGWTMQFTWPKAVLIG